MRSRLARLSLAVAALAVAFAGPAAAQKESKAVADVRKLDQEALAALIARDSNKTMSYYWNSPDLFRVDDAGAVMKGYDAVKAAYGGFLSAAESIQLTCADRQYWEAGNGVLGACPFKLKFKTKGRPEITSEGWYTNFWRKIGGKWLIVYEHVSLNPPPPPDPKASLYKRLGGYDALAAVSDDFLGRLAADKQLGRFFPGVSKAHLQGIRQHVVDFLCMATGGPCVYVGRDMKSTHSGLGITGADWDRMVGFLQQTLDKFHVPDRERKEVVTALAGLKPDIVDKP